MAARKTERIREDLGSAGEVIAAQVEQKMLGRRSSWTTADAEITTRSGKAILKVERDLARDLERLVDALSGSRQELHLHPETVERVVRTGLLLAHHKDLTEVPDPRPDQGARCFRLPELPGAWARARNDGLRHPLTGRERLVVFDEVEARDRTDVVHLHLGHRLVQMCLRLLRAELWSSGAAAHLSRVTARVVPDGALRQSALVAHGRVVITGSGGTRLHEEVITAGGLIEGSKLVAAKMEDVDGWLAEATDELPAADIRTQLTDLWPQLEDRLARALNTRANRRFRSLETLLAERCEEEVAGMRAVLADLGRSIRDRLDDTGHWQQESLFDVDDERRQLRADREALQERLRRLPEVTETETETAALRRRWADPSPRWFPVAVTFLVPRSLSPPRSLDRPPGEPLMPAAPAARKFPPKGSVPTPAEQHEDWLRLLRPDGPFVSLPVLVGAFPQGLDTIPKETWTKLRQAWAEAQEDPALLRPAWERFVLTELIGWRAPGLREGAAIPELLHAGANTPDAVLLGPGQSGGKTPRALFFRTDDWEGALNRPRGEQPGLADRAADLCRARDVPLALLTNGREWALVHARPKEATTVAVFDADLWTEEPILARAFASLLSAGRVVRPPLDATGKPTDSTAGLFARTAEAQSDVTDTLGRQVREAVSLLVAELSRLDRESRGELLPGRPRQARLRGRAHRDDAPRLPPLRGGTAPAARRGRAVRRLVRRRPLARRTGDGPEPARRRAGRPGRGDLAAPARRVRRHSRRLPRTTGCGSPRTAARSSTRPASLGWSPPRSPTAWSTRSSTPSSPCAPAKASRARNASPTRASTSSRSATSTRVCWSTAAAGRTSRTWASPSGGTRSTRRYCRWPAWRSGRQPATPRGPGRRGDGDEGRHRDCGAGQVGRGHGRAGDGLRQRHGSRRAGGCLLRVVRPRPARRAEGVARGLGHRRPLRQPPRHRHALHAESAGGGGRRAHARAAVLRAGSGGGRGGGRLAAEEGRGAAEAADPGPGDGLGGVPGLGVPVPVGPRGGGMAPGGRAAAEIVQDVDRDDHEQLHQIARRLVADRCLYGVDRDPMAVELAKLSLWLVTLAKGRPFSFLDHALRSVTRWWESSTFARSSSSIWSGRTGS